MKGAKEPKRAAERRFRFVSRSPTGGGLGLGYFHKPGELKAEIEDAGFLDVDIRGVIGPCWLIRNLDHAWKNETKRENILRIVRLLEKEDSLMGLSTHFLSISKKDNVFEKAVSAMNPKSALQNSVDAMTNAIVGILSGNAPSVYLYGSIALDDFRLGWSDIDLLVLTEKQISPTQEERLVHLRQELTEREPENPYYRLFEGGMLSFAAFLSNTEDTVVYWGTSGERITDRYDLDNFCKKELLDNGVLLYGKDVRGQIRRPTYEDLKMDVRRHYETIREHGGKTGRSLYSFGWLLDISRCIYTLRAGKIIAKTEAGVWALENELCPDAAALETALRVRKEPHLFAEDEALRHYAENLGDAIQAYADVLEKEL